MYNSKSLTIMKKPFHRLLQGVIALMTLVTPLVVVAVTTGSNVKASSPALASAADSVPAAPTMTLTADAQKKPYVDVVVSVPAKDKSGNATTVTKLTIYRANVVYKTIIPEAGQTSISFKDTVPANHKSYTYGAVATNSYGNSARTNKSIYVGVQKPKAPTNITIQADAANHRKGNVTWLPPTQDAGNGALDLSQVTYTVILKNNAGQSTVIQDSCATSSCDFEYTGAGYDLFSITVTACNVGGASNAAPSGNKIFLGDPLTQTIVESYPGGVKTQLLLTAYEDLTGSRGWSTCTDALQPYINSCDNDNGYMGMLSDQGCIGVLMSNYIDIAKFNKPSVTMNVYKALDQGSMTVQLTAVIDSMAQVISSFDVSELPLHGWNKVGIDLSAFKGKYPQFMIRVLNHAYNNFFRVDNIRIGEALNSDISIGSLSVPEYIMEGIQSEISAVVTNEVNTESKQYTVELKRNGRTVATRNMQALQPFESVKISLPDILDIAAGDSIAVYTMNLTMDADQNQANNTTDAKTALKVSSFLPPVTNLTSNSTPSSVDLSWAAPDLSSLPVEPIIDSFEEYQPYSNSFGTWKTIDGDQRVVGGFTVNGVKLPVTGNQPFFVIDVDTFNCRDFIPRQGGGRRMAASLYTNDNKPANDWLISPRLSGCPQVIEFDVKGYYNFSAPWDVFYSTTGCDTTDFQLLKSDVYKGEWKRFSYPLPEGTTYFAIRARQIGPMQGNPPIFLVDAVKYIPFGQGQGNFKGYNIYCGNQLLTPNPISTTYFNSQPRPEGSIYKITALYDKGESLPRIIDVSAGVNTLTNYKINVESNKGEIIINTEISINATIYNIQGVKIHTHKLVEGKNTLEAIPGIYIVKVAGRQYKVAVP